jgi:hypothetical protein
MEDKWESIYKEAFIARPTYHPENFVEGPKKPTKISVRIAGVATEIRTEHFPIKIRNITAKLVTLQQYICVCEI